MLFIAAFLILFASMSFALAQGVAIDAEVLKKILNLAFIPFGTGGVIGLSELIKRWIWPNETTRPKWSGYLTSIGISVLSSAAYFAFFAPPFVLITFAGYAVIVALAANGLYKAF